MIMEAENQETVQPVMEDFQELGTPEQLAELYGALAEAKLGFGKIVKNRTVSVRMKSGGEYTFEYADLESSLDATTKALSEQGLAVIQPPSIRGVIRTILAHKGGARLVTVLAIPEAEDIKSYGGNITYMRRYAYNALLCLSADQDTDDAPVAARGEERAVSGPRRTPQAPAQARQEQRPVELPRKPSEPPSPAQEARVVRGLTPEQRDNMRALLRACGVTSQVGTSSIVHDILGVAPGEVDSSNYERLCNELRRRSVP